MTSAFLLRLGVGVDSRLSSNANDAVGSPLNTAELDVLRAQYEKEGEMVGVQTKFNYAWVRPARLSCVATPSVIDI